MLHVNFISILKSINKINNSKWETSQTLIHTCMNKEIRAYLYIEIMHYNKNEQTADCMDSNELCLVEWKPDKKQYILQLLLD